MLDGLQHVIAQIAAIVAVAAVLAGILGWLVGRAGSKRRAAKALASTSASRLQPTAAPTTPPAPAVFEPVAPLIEAVPVAAPREASAPAVPQPAVYAPFAAEPVAPAHAMIAEPVAAPIAYVPTHAFSEPSDSYLEEDYEEDDDPDPDRTVLRPARSFGSATTPYVPPRFSVATPTPSGRELTTVVPASVQEVQELRREVRAKELELGRLEAGALSAWDRTVPALEARISELQDENDLLRRQIREAEEHSDADALTVDRLRSLVAERDSRLAEMRAQS